jgi:hypothetical protein
VLDALMRMQGWRFLVLVVSALLVVMFVLEMVSEGTLSETTIQQVLVFVVGAGSGAGVVGLRRNAQQPPEWDGVTERRGPREKGEG